MNLLTSQQYELTAELTINRLVISKTSQLSSFHAPDLQPNDVIGPLLKLKINIFIMFGLALIHAGPVQIYGLTEVQQLLCLGMPKVVDNKLLSQLCIAYLSVLVHNKFDNVAAAAP